jgi:ATP-dependent helicase HrpA
LGKIISADALKQNMIEVVLDEILNSFKSQIQTKTDFERLIIHAHKHFSSLIQALSDELMLIAQSFHDLSRMRSSINNLPSKVIEDIDEQVEILLPPYEKPLFKFDRLRDFNRYLKGIIIRLDKFNQRPTKDLELMREINRLKNKWIEKVVRYVENDEDVPHGFIDFQWDMQELRVSLFAQELKTAYPISIKRLDERWMKLID